VNSKKKLREKKETKKKKKKRNRKEEGKKKKKKPVQEHMRLLIHLFPFGIAVVVQQATQTQDIRHKTQDTRHKTQDTRHKTEDKTTGQRQHKDNTITNKFYLAPHHERIHAEGTRDGSPNCQVWFIRHELYSLREKG
jgi:hypothetical protein